MAVELRPYQREAVETIASRLKKNPTALLQAPTGSGKCLAPGTPVLLYDGRVAPVENLKIGDRLMGPDSLPREIVSLASGREEMFQIVPNKGAPFAVNSSHVLSLRITGMGRGKAALGPGGERHKAGDIVNVSVADYLKGTKTFRHVAKGYRAGAVAFPWPERELPIPPYILGVWLGDGTSNSSEICNVDHEVLKAWRDYAVMINHVCSLVECKGRVPIHRIKHAYDRKGVNTRSHPNKSRHALFQLNLTLNKHIPQIYKTASVNDRLELLAGIIDTDGYLSRGCYDLCLKQETLANDIAFVARSLGLAAYVKPAMKKCGNTGTVNQYWRIGVSGDVSAIPCKVARRVASPRSQKKSVTRFGFSVRPLGEGPYYGFELAGPDGRFLLGDFTVTHNTVILSELIRRLMSDYPRMRIAAVVHRQELVNQNRDKLLTVWPEGFLRVGVACAGVGKVEVDKPVTVGSIQTMERRTFSKPFDLLIVDECHHLAPLEDRDQYFRLIRSQKSLNGNLRVFGVTATPYRLNHGYIYGDGCKEGSTNFFRRLDFSITLDQLIGQGYLVPWRAKHAIERQLDLRGIKTTAGDWDLGELSRFMSKEIHLRSAVDAYGKYGEGRKSVLVFAVSISHAERLAEVFREAGHEAAAIHSKLDPQLRRSTLADFDRGRLQFLVNVGILTEGWDSPRLDEILMCRPTKSPGLFVQMVGRGTRLFEGKENLLILDLAGNFARHGDPSNPSIASHFGKGTGEAPMKVCPGCQALVPLGAKLCPECGHRLVEEKTEVEKSPKLVDYGAGAKLPVSGFSVVPHTSLKGQRMAKLMVDFGIAKSVPVYLGFESYHHPFFRGKSRRIWQMLAKTSPPRDSGEAVDRQGELALPEALTAGKDKNSYWVIKEFK